MTKKVALIGSGNVFFKDEGIGLYGAKYLKENYEFSPPLDIVDGGTLGFKLMPLIREYDAVVIINTSSEEMENTGKISVKTTDEFLDGGLIKKTANEVEIAQMLQISSLVEEMAQMIFISIVPEDIISVEVGLTCKLKERWEAYIATVLENIELLDVQVSRKNTCVSLEEILEIFANPSIEHARGF